MNAGIFGGIASAVSICCNSLLKHKPAIMHNSWPEFDIIKHILDEQPDLESKYQECSRLMYIADLGKEMNKAIEVHYNLLRQQREIELERLNTTERNNYYII